MNFSLERLDAFYSEALGCPLAEVEPGEVRVTTSERRLRCEEGYGVVFPFYLLLTRGRCVVSVRPELEEAVRAIVGDAPDAQALFGEGCAAAIKAACRALLPATVVGRLRRSHSLNFYVSQERFRPYKGWRGGTAPADVDCRRLAPGDRELIDEMSRASVFGCPEECLQDGTAFGVIADGKLAARSTTIPTPVAMGKYGLVWVGVETLSDYRRRGYAKAVVSGTTETLLARRLTPAYDCTITNVASANTARAVGYELYGETLRWRYRGGEA